MGNKKSSPKTVSQKDTVVEDPVKRRSHQGPRKERPLSDPGLGNNDVSLDPSGFILRPKGVNRGELRGKINSEVLDVPVVDYESPSDQPTMAQLNQYRDTLNQVVGIWPEYIPLRSIHVEEFSASLLTTLQQVANRLCQQHNSIRKVSEDYHELKQINEELLDERNALRQMLQKREHEVANLHQDVVILKVELKRRGHDAKLPSRHSVSEPISEHYSPRSDSMSIHEEESKRAKSKDHRYSATPLLLAEGERSQQMLTKRLSLGLADSGGSGDRWAWPESNAPDDLKERVKWLQLALEKEKEKNRYRDDLSPVGSRKYKQNEVIIDHYAQRFTALQHEAFDKIRRLAASSLRDIDDNKQQKFIGSIIQEGFIATSDTVAQLENQLHLLLTDPTRAMSSQTRAITSQRLSVHEPHGVTRKNSILENVRKFEDPSRGKLRRGKNIPDELVKHVYNYLTDTSDKMDLTILIENTFDRLRNDFGDCLNASLINQSNFTNFIHDTCRLCWQLNIHNPPLHISSDVSKFESRYHVANAAAATAGDDIDYYLWPILLSKRNGDVLRQGIVAIKR